MTHPSETFNPGGGNGVVRNATRVSQSRSREDERSEARRYETLDAFPDSREHTRELQGEYVVIP